MVKGSGWVERNATGTSARCRSCEKDPGSVPGPGCTNARHLTYHLKRKQARKDLNTAAKTRWRRRLKVIELLGGQCRACGNSDPRVLQINHIEGGGTREREDLFGDPFARAILNGTRGKDDLEILCANCNILYEFQVGRRVLPDL